MRGLWKNLRNEQEKFLQLFKESSVGHSDWCPVDQNVYLTVNSRGCANGISNNKNSISNSHYF